MKSKFIFVLVMISFFSLDIPRSNAAVGGCQADVKITLKSMGYLTSTYTVRGLGLCPHGGGVDTYVSLIVEGSGNGKANRTCVGDWCDVSIDIKNHGPDCFLAQATASKIPYSPGKYTASQGCDVPITCKNSRLDEFNDIENLSNDVFGLSSLRASDKNLITC